MRTEDIDTEVFFFPPPRTPRRTAPSPTPSGCCSGTTRRSRAAPATQRSDLWFIYHLGRRIRERLARTPTDEARPADPGAHLGLPDRGPARRAERRRGARARSTAGTPTASRSRPTRSSRSTARPRAAAGSTAASTPAASTRPPGARPAREQNWIGGEWALGLAGQPPDPLQPRLGRPAGPARGASARRSSGGTSGRRRGPATTSRTSRPTSRPTTGPPPGATRTGRDRRRRPVHHAGRRPRLAVRARRPGRRPAAHALRAAGLAGAATSSTASSATRHGRSSRTETTATTPIRDEPGRGVFPYVLTTYRLTEHFTAGGMTPLDALPVRAAARVLLRGLARAGRRARPGARRLGDDRHRARRHRGARAWSPTA